MPVATLTDARVRGLAHADGEIIDVKSGLLVRADRTGAITFSFRYRSGAARRRVTLGRYPAMSLADARLAAGRLREQVRGGADPQQDRRTGLTFDALADLYLERYAKVEKSSWKNDVGLLRRHVRPAWGKRAAASITRVDAARLLFDVVAKAPVSANRLRAVLAKLFGWAVDSAMLADTPMLGVKRPHREGSGKTRVLSDDEVRTLWRALDRGSATGAALKVMLLLGARPGEVAGMAVGELQALDDPQAACWELPPERMKARRSHVVPLPPLARAILREQAGTEFVFAASRAECRRLLKHRMARTLALALERPATPHDVRRTVATNLSKLGIPRDDRLAVLAHSYGDVHEVYDRYDRLPQKRAALEAWERHLAKVIAGDPGGANIIPLRTAVPSW